MENSSVIAFLYGSDDGLVASEATKTYALWAEGTDEFSHEIIDGGCNTVDEVAEVLQRTSSALMTMPFFPGKKIVWLKGCNFLADSPMGRSESTIELLLSLLETLKNLPSDVCFLLSAFEVDLRRTFPKTLISLGESREFTKLDTSKPGWEANLASLVSNEAAARNISFTRDAMDIFIHRINESTRQITNELDKLDAYLGAESREVTEEIVLNMVAVSKTSIVFEISRAIESNKAALALKLITDQLDAGDQAVGIIRAAIIPTLRNFFIAKLLCERFKLNTRNYNEFAAQCNSLSPEGRSLIPSKKDGSPNTYPLFLAAQKCSTKSLAQLKKALAACAYADKALVSSQIEDETILHQLIATITS